MNRMILEPHNLVELWQVLLEQVPILLIYETLITNLYDHFTHKDVAY